MTLMKTSLSAKRYFVGKDLSERLLGQSIQNSGGMAGHSQLKFREGQVNFSICSKHY
jgi:hypothetical protein